jgi:hypothetical protein
MLTRKLRQELVSHGDVAGQATSRLGFTLRFENPDPSVGAAAIDKIDRVVEIEDDWRSARNQSLDPRASKKCRFSKDEYYIG